MKKTKIKQKTGIRISKRKIKIRALKKTNLERKNIIFALKKIKNAKALYLAKLLAYPRRKQIIVNLDKINRLTKDNELVIIPGKVLGNGDIDHKINITAFNYSNEALKKLEKSKSEINYMIDLKEIKENAKIII